MFAYINNKIIVVGAQSAENFRKVFEELKAFLKTNKSPDYNFVYDQVIGYGELVSTTIISAYLNEVGYKNNWIDVRQLIKTDDYYRRANVNWDQTQTNILTHINTKQLNITQGFLGSDKNKHSPGTFSPMKGITEIGPGNLKLVFSPDSGLLKQMHNSRTGVMFLVYSLAH